VGSKNLALLTLYSSLADQSSLSRSSDTKSILRKTTSENSCKNLSADQTVGSQIMTLYSRLADKSFSSLSSDSINTRRNTTYEKSCKNIKRDPTVGLKLMALLTRYSSFADGAPCHEVAIPNLPQGKQHPETRVKQLSAIKRWDQKLWPFWPVTQVLPTRDPRLQVAIP
jgi:hypothetical protein